MKNLRIGLSLLFILCAPALAQAEKKPIVPQTLEGTTVISAEECKKLMREGAKAFDVRNALEYEEGHIPGAISVVYKEKSEKSVHFDARLDSFDLKKLPSDKSAPMIIYCNGDTCWKSFKASTAAVKAGYQKVYWFKGGLPEWKEKGFVVEK